MIDGLETVLPEPPPSSQSLPASSSSPPPPSLALTATASAWYNLTALVWAANVSRYAPILGDLVLAGPRMVMKLGSLMTSPESMDVSVLQHASSAAAAAPGSEMLSSLVDKLDVNVNLNLNDVLDLDAIETSFAAADGPADIAQPPRISIEGARGFSGVLAYATSKWAFASIAMLLVINRTHIFAATRRRLYFSGHVRFLLRVIPVCLLINHAIDLLHSIQCQTSPNFAELRWGDANKSSDLAYAHPSSFLNAVSSALLFGSSDQQSCASINMIQVDVNATANVNASTDGAPGISRPELQGSLSRLWPLYGALALSHFLESVSCAVQGRTIAAETGMTLFEQSLAFAEADATVNNQLGWESFPKPSFHSASPNPGQNQNQNTNPSGSSPSSPSHASNVIAMTRSILLKRANTSTEVLVIAFLSCMSHITSHILGIADLQARYRLLNTGLWGLCFMGIIFWSACLSLVDNPASPAFLRFPTVCLLGFVPHVLIIIGISICVTIYGFALLLSALTSPANEERSGMSLRQRISYAHENMQANMSLSEVRITRDMDFYTALLRAGIAAITMATEAVYLNEDGGIHLKRHTWLEEARYREAEELQRQCVGIGLPGSRFDQIGAIGLIPVKGGSIGVANGYGRERAAQKVPRGRGDRYLRSGMGSTQRSSRWIMAFLFMSSINKLCTRIFALSLLWLLGALRIRSRPALLVWLARGPKRPTPEDAAAAAAAASSSSSSTSSARARLKRDISPSNIGAKEELAPPAECVDDVEAEFRRVGETRDEESLDNDLYKYWLKGGWWGSKDASGDFQPNPEDEDWDATSVITMTTNNERNGEESSGWSSGWSSQDDEDEDEEDEEEDGQRTPTQRSPQRTRENTPFVDSPLEMRDLARLLRPTNPEEREEAETLAAHLQSDRILTRSGFRRLEKLQRTRILTMPTSSSSPLKKRSQQQQQQQSGPAGRVVKLTPDEEERLLEELLLTRRQLTEAGRGSTEMGDADGPLCVVCQCSPRTVIVWPCRCLSLCDDCRVSLAMNNFDKCVCCRRDVMSFSRIYVP